MSTVSQLVSNPVSVFFLFIFLVTTVPMAITYWYKARKAGIDADLKMKMLEMGMTASDIERVLAAESSPEKPLDMAHFQAYQPNTNPRNS